jgi:hypothetical protein
MAIGLVMGMIDNLKDTTYDTDLAIAQSMFALINIRALILQNRNQEALEWINGEYLTQSALLEIEDLELRNMVEAELGKPQELFRDVDAS